jgi:hypothetical protein
LNPETLSDPGAFGVVALVLTYLFRRLNAVEKRLLQAEQAIHTEQVKNSRLERLLERVCTGYESVRRELLKLSRMLRQGDRVSDEYLSEIEGTPDITELLKSPLDTSDARPVA